MNTRIHIIRKRVPSSSFAAHFLYMEYTIIIINHHHYYHHRQLNDNETQNNNASHAIVLIWQRKSLTEIMYLWWWIFFYFFDKAQVILNNTRSRDQQISLAFTRTMYTVHTSREKRVYPYYMTLNLIKWCNMKVIFVEGIFCTEFVCAEASWTL